MPSPSAPRRRLAWIALAVIVLGGLGFAGWQWLGGYAVRSVLRLAGANAIRYTRVAATPRHIEIDGLEFSLGTQAFSARHVTLQRDRWWTTNLGNVRVEGARAAFVLDGSDVNPWNWQTYEAGGLGADPVALPFTSLDLDGELVVSMAGLPDQAVAIKLEGRPRSATSWFGSLVAEGPGFKLAGGGSLLRAGQELDFQVHSAELDLGVWAHQVNRLVMLPGGPWTLGGRLTGVAEGKVTAKRFAATARISLHDGRMHAGTRDVEATGVEAELEFSDLWKYRTKAGTFRIGALRVGKLAIEDVRGGLGLWGAKQVNVDGATFSALGGRVAVEPFRYFLDQRELTGAIRLEGIEAARVLALANGVGGSVVGKVDGPLKLRIQSDGVRIDGGQLTLTPGTSGQLQTDSFALSRSGAVLDDAGKAVLRDLRTAPLQLKLTDLRLDIRPPDLPLGVSARLRAAGTTPEGATVGFTLNVNGSVERYMRIMP